MSLHVYADIDAAIDQRSRATARLNWWVVALLAGIALAVGVAPVAWLLKRPIVTLQFGAGMAAFALLAPRTLARSLTKTQYFFEFRQMLSSAAVVGLFWMGIYVALVEIEHVAHSLRRSIPEPAQFGFEASISCAALLALLASVGMWEDLHKRMALPPDGGSIWYPVISRPDWGSLLTLMALFLIPMTICHFVWPAGVPLFAQLALIVLPRDLGDGHTDEVRAAERIFQSFKTDDYSVTMQPRIGNPEFDELLKPIDFFAEAPHASFAVQVKMGDAESPPADWKLASSLRAAATLYAREPAGVQCLLVLIGLRAGPGLKAFADREGITLFEFHGKAVQHVAGPESVRAELLRKWADEDPRQQPAPQEAAQR